MGIVTRGFRGRARTSDVKLPPGQYLTEDFPVLSAGPTPRISLDTWEFTVTTETGTRDRWTWTDLLSTCAAQCRWKSPSPPTNS